MNFYEVLNISTKANEKDIKKAYRLLAKKYHPDTYIGNKEFAEAKMQEINVAYDTLSNVDLRKKYDAKIGVNIKETDAQPIKNDNYSNSKTKNSYDKSGVNYEVRYRPNNKNIEYDSRGYAESNYYTAEKEEVWSPNGHISFKKLKEKLNRKNIITILVMVVVALVICSIIIYKAVESMNEFFVSTKGIYDKVNAAKIENLK